MGKHISKELEWDDIIPMATAAYNFFPHTLSKERPFFLMFGQDLLTGLQNLPGETTRYLGNKDNRLGLTALQNTYQLVAQNVQMARGKGKEDESSVPPAFQPGDLVTLRDSIVKAIEQKYKGEYRVIKIFRKDTRIAMKFKRRRNETPCSILKEDKSSTGNSGKNTRLKKSLGGQQSFN